MQADIICIMQIKDLLITVDKPTFFNGIYITGEDDRTREYFAARMIDDIPYEGHLKFDSIGSLLVLKEVWVTPQISLYLSFPNGIHAIKYDGERSFSAVAEGEEIESDFISFDTD